MLLAHSGKYNIHCSSKGNGGVYLLEWHFFEVLQVMTRRECYLAIIPLVDFFFPTAGSIFNNWEHFWLFQCVKTVVYARDRFLIVNKRLPSLFDNLPKSKHSHPLWGQTVLSTFLDSYGSITVLVILGLVSAAKSFFAVVQARNCAEWPLIRYRWLNSYYTFPLLFSLSIHPKGSQTFRAFPENPKNITWNWQITKQFLSSTSSESLHLSPSKTHLLSFYRVSLDLDCSSQRLLSFYF